MLTYYEVESAKMDAVSALPRSEGSVEIDYFLSDAPVGSRNERPMCAYVLLMTDAKTGYVLGTEILHATDGLEGMLSRIPSKMLEVFSRSGSIPESIAVSRPVLSQILAPFEDRLAIEVDLTDSLPATTEARRSLGEFLR
ncbi:MAG: hypothetical protein GWM98_08730 [Nitrospinaceae bacterium]|nr:hypothetical protein [Nitrospinaceae bacterium]